LDNQWSENQAILGWLNKESQQNKVGKNKVGTEDDPNFLIGMGRLYAHKKKD